MLNAQVNELVQRVLTDASERVRERGRSALLPAFALWADSLGLFQQQLVSVFLIKLVHLIQVNKVMQSQTD